jgi:four helix bundle protein
MGQSYRQFIAWQKAMDFVMDLYRTTKTFPRDETYVLASQLRRTAVAIPTNIAEGASTLLCERVPLLFGTSQGSLGRGRNPIDDRSNLAYFTPEHGKNLLDIAAELGKILNGLIGAIRPAA